MASMTVIFILLAVIVIIFLGRFTEIVQRCREAVGTCSLGTRRTIRRIMGRTDK